MGKKKKKHSTQRRKDAKNSTTWGKRQKRLRNGKVHGKGANPGGGRLLRDLAPVRSGEEAKKQEHKEQHGLG